MAQSTRTDEKAHHERQIRDASEKVLAAQALLEVRVIAARKANMPWSLIARGCGIARQSATEKYEKLPELAEMADAAQR